MMNKAVDSMVAVGTGTQNSKHQIQLIVSYLMQALNIPEGNDLVRFFGSGHEQDNRQALAYWIETHLDEINPDHAERRLRKLVSEAAGRIEGQTCND